jgi:hypothetical protein
MCSTEAITTREGKQFDASIPPLSATAGILLAAELRRLQVGLLMDESQNFTAVELSQERPSVQRKTRRCRESCTVRLPPEVRRALDSHSRWIELDAQ